MWVYIGTVLGAIAQHASRYPSGKYEYHAVHPLNDHFYPQISYPFYIVLMEF